MEYIIHDLDTLHKLQADKNLKNSIRKIRITLQLPGASQHYERELNRLYFACGCQEGSLGVFAALIIMLGMFVMSGFDVILVWWKIAIIFFAAALMGKLTGLLISRYRLIKVYSELENYFRTEMGSSPYQG